VIDVSSRDGAAFETLAMYKRVDNPARARAGGGGYG